ncbi:energy-coupling factor ABC transporter permease [Pseudorhodoferax sp.]|uniref:energy-coupling factor ABC transporter permease n=1 Tax=Pseudorhodoferax sp. TaxID=1993553 RepID=UPI002DD65581|nr:energy-coupling factor ABC transporter permease [Pseudorhodoferax sp.]
MHIPDGFVSPQTYLPATLLAAGAWAWAARGLRATLHEDMLPRLAMLTALAYALGLVMLPLPGASSGHVLGVAMLGLLFGVRLAFLAYSLVLALQALLFGAGGITTLPLNALLIGLLGAVTAVAVFRLLRPVHETAAVALAAWASVMVSALALGGMLALQPLLAQAPDGTPRYFPFGWQVVLPALLLPHLAIACAEALLTVLVWRHARRRRWVGQAASHADASAHTPAMGSAAE